MHVFEWVAMRVVSQFLELAAFANLPLRTDSKSILAQENHGDSFALLEKIRIHTDFNIRRLRTTHIPQAEARPRLKMCRGNPKTSAIARRARPSHHRLLRRCRQFDAHIR